ncbi:MAG: beta-lactamase family protein [Bifidobacteriaceae bacterium]|jgi:CubicO group peptidase (beta-lactamase class C family)|nr:beta-lactamase family protein [Bifidobacteriaceae bacterium]
MAWDRVVALAEGRGGAYSLLALRDGEVVAEHSKNCGPDSLFYCYSVTKPITAMAVHLLAERGQLHLDDSIAAHWPEYARHGKAGITIRQVLTHRAGVPAALGHPGLDMAVIANWDVSVRAAARARPRWPPGQVVAYHVVTFGFILGELVRRVSGQPISQFVDQELFQPLAMDAYLALPAGQLGRAVPLRPKGGNLASPLYLNRPAARQAVAPAASLHTTARSLAAFYQMLLNAGAAKSGRRLFAPETVAAALAVSSDGEMDRTLRQPQRYSQGFQLGGLPGVARGMGSTAPPSAFGHNGSGVCSAWAEPARGLIFVYLSNTTQFIGAGRRFASDLSDAAWSAFAAARAQGAD